MADRPGRPWSEVRRDMEAAGLARPRAAYYPLSLLTCGHWQPTEPVATLTASDLDAEDCRKCGQRVTRLYQWFPPKEDAYEPARTTSRCPKCGAAPGAHRHYPSDYSKPVDRFYCAPCDEEWWSDA